MLLLDIAPTDLIDIAVVGLLLWGLVIWTRRVHARMALIGLAFLGGFYLLARQFELQLTAWIFQGFFAVLVVLLVVVFQDDLRRLFEQIAALGLRRKASRPEIGSLGVLVRSLRQLAEKRRGALLVLPGREPVERHLQGGVYLNATISEELLDSLFDPGSAGHDGALVMRDNKLERFAVHLPLSENRDELGPGGTRHAAALGLAERSDSLCLVVSEERGTIGIAAGGRLEVLEDTGELLDRVQGYLQRAGAAGKSRLAWGWWGRRIAEAVVSFGLAAAAWLVLVPGAAQEEVTHQVPVTVANMPEGYALVGVKPPVVAVTVAGPRRAMLLARLEDFRIVIDANLVNLGRRTFAMAVDSVRHDTDLQVMRVDPPKVKLAVKKDQGHRTKIALHDIGDEEYVQFMRPLGVEYVVSAVGPGISGALEVDNIVRKKEYFAAHGMTWDVIENLDLRIYYGVMLGEGGREQQLDRVYESIRAVGEVGIGVLQYQQMLLGGLRSEYSPTG